ncbi:MAG TPA: DUF2156 domain-containing protein [Candidatus Binatia bacterium]|jgi:phosphatidylglycerol lysyltransferase
MSEDRQSAGAAAATQPLERARALVLAHGTAANSYQILNPGIAYWFSRDGDAVAGFVEFGRFRIVAGAPTCAPQRLAAVLDEFERDARSSGLRVCYFGGEAALASALGSSSRHALLSLGAQPVWNPSHWADCVGTHASLRAQLRRARNKAVLVREVPTDVPVDVAPLQRCLDEWVATRAAPPMHFLVEPQTLGRLFDRRLFIAERYGDIVGFLVASPVPGRQGWLIEQVIRGRGSVNGTAELLIDAAIRELARDGSRFVTLGLSPLSPRAQAEPGKPPPWLRLLLGWLRAHGRRFYNFEGLDAFKAKLRPESWEPVYAVADRPYFSPQVLHAIAGAFTDGAPVAATLRALGWAVAQEARTLASRLRIAGPSRPQTSPASSKTDRSSTA